MVTQTTEEIVAAWHRLQGEDMHAIVQAMPFKDPIKNEEMKKAHDCLERFQKQVWELILTNQISGENKAEST